MKRRKSNINFSQQITYKKLYKAYLCSRKSKRSRTDVIKFSLRQEDFIESICYELKNGLYTFGKYKEFYVYEPKKRKILAATFKDRIVHTWYVHNFLEKMFIKSFIPTTYACIKDRGMHKCALKIKKDMYNLFKIWNNAYVIKMDVKKFFQSIDRNILYEIIENRVKDRDFLEFTKKILNSGSMHDENEGISLPIGNYTSQIFGNIYLDTVDKYATNVLKCKYYYRYMDDTCIIVENKEKAKQILSKIEKFYKEVLNLELNQKTQIFKLKQGINFCGYKIKIGRMNLRNSGKKNLLKKMKYIRKKVSENNMEIEEAKKLLVGHIGYTNIADVESLVDKYFYIR